MRLTRTITGLLAAALVGLAPVALASAPANAAAYTTTTALEVDRNLIEFQGDYKPWMRGEVRGSDGYGVSDGTVELQASEAGGAWKTIDTREASGYLDYSDVVPTRNTTYRLTYLGGANDYDTYSASQSGNVTVKVTRKLTLKNPRGTKVIGKVAPKYAKKKVLIQKKVGKKWKKFRVLRTSTKSSFTITLPASRKRTYFKFVVPGDKSYVTRTYEVATIRR